MESARSIRRSPCIEPSISAESIVSAYRVYAPLYDRFFGLFYAHGHRELAQVVERVQPRSLLEVGVGTGLTLPRYPASTRVVGIDLCEEMLRRARRRASALPDHDISLKVMDAERMDFPDEQFDCVVLSYVLSVTPDVDRLVAEVQRVCRPGGLILVLNHFSGSRFWWLFERVAKRFADRVGFRSDFRYDDNILCHPWKVESVRTVNLFGLSKLVVLRNE